MKIEVTHEIFNGPKIRGRKLFRISEWNAECGARVGAGEDAVPATSYCCSGYLSGMLSVGPGLEMERMLLDTLQKMREDQAICLTTYLNQELNIRL